MENKKNSKGLIVLLIILVLCVLGLTGYILYNKNHKGDSDNLVNENQKTNEQTKENNIYKNFSSNLKSEISKKYDSNNLNYQTISNEVVKDGYEVFLTKENTLYVKYNNANLLAKYGEYKIAENVLNFYIISTGQGGGNTLYFINEDGTVGSADTEYNIENENQINIKKDIGYKNIVSIVNGTFGDGYSGVNGPIFIDIEGNIFSENL